MFRQLLIGREDEWAADKIPSLIGLDCVFEDVYCFLTLGRMSLLLSCGHYVGDKKKGREGGGESGERVRRQKVNVQRKKKKEEREKKRGGKEDINVSRKIDTWDLHTPDQTFILLPCYS